MPRKHPLLFGTAGLPQRAKGRPIIEGFQVIRELGLQGMEVEFVHGARMKDAEASKINGYLRESGLFATVHGPYYINLNAQEEMKLVASRERIMESARLGALLGATSLTFHAAFYLQQEAREVFGRVRAELAALAAEIGDNSYLITLRPELTGKSSQFGDLAEIIALSRQVSGVAPCVDFAHHHARHGGRNSYADFAAVLQQIKEQLGEAALQDMHIHVSGIEYGDKGERRHLNLADSDFNYRELLRALRDYGVGGRLICESPNLEDDALLLMKCYQTKNDIGNK